MEWSVQSQLRGGAEEVGTRARSLLWIVGSLVTLSGNHHHVDSSSAHQPSLSLVALLIRQRGTTRGRTAVEGGRVRTATTRGQRDGSDDGGSTGKEGEGRGRGAEGEEREEAQRSVLSSQSFSSLSHVLSRPVVESDKKLSRRPMLPFALCLPTLRRPPMDNSPADPHFSPVISTLPPPFSSIAAQRPMSSIALSL